MNRGWWLRFGLLVFFIALAVVYVFPTMANLNLETTKFPFKKKVNLGLDLQGGLYMVYGVDFQKVYRETLSRSVAGFTEDLKKAGVTAQVGDVNSTAAEDPSVVLSFPAGDHDKVKEALSRQGYTLRTLEDKPGSLELALGRDYRGVIRDNTLNQSVQVIRNRIDEFGVSEPSIATKGDNRVVVELPGVKDVERAKALVGHTARLEFKKVNAEAQVNLPALVAEARQKGIVYKEGEKYADYVGKLNEYLKGKIPADSQLLFERPGATAANADTWIPYLLFKDVRLTGAELTDAMVSFDQQTQQPHVSFQMNPRGAITFENLTREMAPVGGRYQYLAIVLDDVVYSAPRILGPIPGGSGQITMGGAGDQAFKEARDLAIVLRAGALPAQLELLEQRAIGPSIGADSITHGITAGLVGCSLLFLFIIVYYKLSGVVATVSLILNFLFTFAILIGLDATLTLPGIAALALTIGMAVDSNVIIFERIRDELTEGKSVAAAVQAGFDKAFSCIFDANITHAIVAIILLNFGTGPIRGFAVTLLIGIVTTLFCAVTVCKLAFDWYLARGGKRRATISI